LFVHSAYFTQIRREAAFLERIKGHDNVVSLLGVVEDNRGPCLRMELCETRDFIALLINRAPLPVLEIVFFAKQLMAGLACIHKAGIRHCDLKPENVLVGRGIQLIITEFELAEESHPSIIRYDLGNEPISLEAHYK
jgi:serine/threonine protein kinase